MLTIQEKILISVLVFIIGLCVGEFLNVCIDRIPANEKIRLGRSRCKNCGNEFVKYDYIPIITWCLKKGKCSKCGSSVSVQYPLVDLFNGALWVVTLALSGFELISIAYCFMIPALIVLSVIDFRTYEIPRCTSIYLMVVAIVWTAIDYQNLASHLIGMLSMGVFLWLLLMFSGGRAIGGGDVKLMTAAGLLFGWKLIIVAFLLGCLYGSVIHIARMKISGEGKQLAMGPYLAAGLISTMWFGNEIVSWYMGFLEV